MKTSQKAKDRAEKLRKIIHHHDHQYHVLDNPEISDEAYDSLLEELVRIEREYPALVVSDSPTQRVGAAPRESFKKIAHAVRQWTFEKVFSSDELREWDMRTSKALDRKPKSIAYVTSHKIDGLKIILTYKAGALVSAATRGDGVMGEEVTANVKTIRTIPLHLQKLVDCIVVGEVWLAQKLLLGINKKRAKEGESVFANTRNAAAGALRQLDPKITAKRKLDSFVYDIDHYENGDAPTTQMGELATLKTLGFKVNPHGKLCKNIEEVIVYCESHEARRKKYEYEMDGIVVSVNDIALQKALGHTAKAPRFGVAYKFAAEQVITIVEDIVLQVGRTGVLTPVAHLKPVRVAGAMVSRATLHNEDEIKRLDVRVGDTVVIERAGDVIPDIVSVVTDLRTGKEKPFLWPSKVAACGGDGSIERVPGEVAWRCVNRNSTEQQKRRFEFFVSRKALNMDGLGKKTIAHLVDEGLLNTPADLFTLTEGDFLTLPGFAEKSARLSVEAIQKSRKTTLERLLVALSIPHVGEEVARVLASHFQNLEALRNSEEADIAHIHGIGEAIARSVILWFKDKHHKPMLDRLLKHLTVAPIKKVKHARGTFIGQTFVLTGTLASFTRDEAKKAIRERGGKVVDSVSQKTDFVVAGENPGAKLNAALAIGAKVLSEQEFATLLK